MRDKEFKRLKRVELVEIIYQLQMEVQKLRDENAELETKLNSRELKISEAGNIADAVLNLSGIFDRAQEACEHYLEEVRRNGAEAEKNFTAKTAEAEVQAEAIIRAAEEEAAVTRRNSEDQIMQAQIESKKIIRSAEQAAAEKLSEAERESEAKWQSVNSRVEVLLKAHSELAALLK